MKIVKDANVVIITLYDEPFGDCRVSPEEGTVGFSVACQEWGFTLNQFARIYASKYGLDSSFF